MKLDEWIGEMAKSEDWNQHKNSVFHHAKQYCEGLISAREFNDFCRYLADNNLEDWGLCDTDS